MVRLYTGCVLSGKTKLLIDFTELLKRDEFLLIGPEIIYGNGSQKVKTRAKGYPSYDCDLVVSSSTDLIKYVKSILKTRDIRGIFCDEVQFLSRKNIDQLIEIEKDYNIKIRCFGISKTHQDGTWDTIEYLKSKDCEMTKIFSYCFFCTKPATTNIRLDFRVNAEIVDISTGDNVEKYCGCCKDCHNKKSTNVE